MSVAAWTASKPSLTGGSYKDVAFGNGEIVAVGDVYNNVSVARSRDNGATWVINDQLPLTPKSPGPYRSFAAVAYGRGLFVAVGDTRYRWDGTTWSWDEVEPSSQRPTLRAIAFGVNPRTHPQSGPLPGRGVFVAVGDNGSIVTTEDGVTWTTRVSNTPKALAAVAFGHGRFVATGEMTVVTSLDAVAWSNAGNASRVLKGLTATPQGFMAVDGSGSIMTSPPNGSPWAPPASVTGLGTGKLESIGWAFGTFVIVGEDGAIYTSTDGLNWTSRSYGGMQFLTGIVHGGQQFITVGVSPGQNVGGDVGRSGEFPSAELSQLVCSAGSLTPAFSPSVTAYTVTPTQGIATVTPTAEDPQATISVRFNVGNEVPVASGTPSAPGQIAGSRIHTFSITVTARNGVTRVYTVKLQHPPLTWK
jgi:hypothetical protein